MKGLERVIHEMGKMETKKTRGPIDYIDPRGMLAVTLIYLISVLTVSPLSLGTLMLLHLYPMLLYKLCRTSYITVVRRSLIAVPFILFAGAFNPLFYNQERFMLFGVSISSGWLGMLSMSLRGMLAVQAVVILLLSSGFRGVGNALLTLRVPRMIVTQLMFLYRYLFIVLSETLSISRAVKSRGYGKPSYPLRLWSRFVGQLLLHSFDRAERIDRAMRSRCYAGHIAYAERLIWRKTDTLFVAVCSMFILLLRLCPLGNINMY